MEIIRRKDSRKNLETTSNHNKNSGANIFHEIAHVMASSKQENKDKNDHEKKENATPQNQEAFTQNSTQKHTGHGTVKNNSKRSGNLICVVILY